MFEHTQEFIRRAVLDQIPKKVLSYTKEQSIYRYSLLYDKVADDYIKKKESSKEPYFSNSKQAAKSRISYITSGQRDKMSAKCLELIAENMNISVSKLLWNEEKEWKPLLPALFYLIMFESLKVAEEKYEAKIALSKKAESVLKESVAFSSELAKKEIRADLSDGMVDFDIRDKKLANAIFRLYQPDVEQKFYQLFKEVFIDSEYAMGYLEREIILFADRVFEEVLYCSSVDQNSIGYQIYKTYDLYFSADAREYRSSFTVMVDKRFSDLEIAHRLAEEQQKIKNALNLFVSELVKLQDFQDERLGYRKTDKELFKVGFDLVGFNKDYFKIESNQDEPKLMTYEELSADIKKAVENETFPI